MREVEFKGMTVEYDERCLKSYKWQKAINSGDPRRSAGAIARLFAGKDEYYAYAIAAKYPLPYDEWLEVADDQWDEGMDAMTELLAVVVEDMGGIAKN